MDLSLLRRIGLTEDQAKTYLLLLESGSLSPLELSKASGEKRTAAYMSLAKLEDIGLAERDSKARPVRYSAVSPAHLETFLANREAELAHTKQSLSDNLSSFLDKYYANSSKPGIRFYEGADTLAKVYQDHLDTKEPVYFVRTEADEAFFGDELYHYMEQRAEAGITAHGLAPDYPGTREYAAKNDDKLKREMTWYNPQQYTAPVEISIYGNKVAFISFGKEAVASIIDSPQIAQAMRELFAMAQAGAEANK